MKNIICLSGYLTWSVLAAIDNLLKISRMIEVFIFLYLRKKF